MQAANIQGLSSASHTRQFWTFHHPTYGSCYTVDGVWTAQRPGITHGECQPLAGVGEVVQVRWPHTSSWPPRSRPRPQG